MNFSYMTCYYISPQDCQFEAWKIVVIVICGLLFLFIVICAIIKIILIILVSHWGYDFEIILKLLFFLWLPGLCRGETMGKRTERGRLLEGWSVLKYLWSLTNCTCFLYP